jgi:hypothetical protein
MKSRLCLISLALALYVTVISAQQSEMKPAIPRVQPQALPYSPAGTLKQYFIGTWRLVSAVTKYPDGKAEPYPSVGPDGMGYLMYDDTGHMCVQLMRKDRPNWADEGNPTAQEALSAILGFSAYCGSYEINEQEHLIIHHPETAWKPNRVGSPQRRPYQLSTHDRFSFVAPGVKILRTGEEVSIINVITWDRVK